MTQSHAAANIQADTKHNNTFEDFTRLADVKTGTKGILQYHFADQVAAKNFLNWLHKHKNIKDITKANIQNSVTDNKTVYIVCLTPEHKNLLNLVIQSQINSSDVKEPQKNVHKREVTQKEANECASALYSITITPAEFKRLLATYHSAVINKALSLKHLFGWTIFSNASRYQPSDNFILLLQKINPEALNQALVIQPFGENITLQVIARHQSHEAFMQVVQKASAETLNQTLVIKDYSYGTALHTITTYQSNEALMELIQKVSAEALNQALVLQDCGQWTALHLIARFQSNEVFMQMIAKVSAEALNQALVLQNSGQWTALHFTARFQSNEAFMQMIAKVSIETLSRALVLQTNDQSTALHFIARYQSNEAFMQMIPKTSAEALNQALAIQNEGQWTALHLIARYQSNEAFMQIIAKLSAEALNQALVLQNSHQLTALYTIARHQSSEAFMQVVQKVSAEALNQSLVIQGKDQRTVLHTITHCHSDEAFMQVIGKVSAEALNKALILQNNIGDTALHEIIYSQSAEAVITVIEKASIQALSQACLCLNKTNKSVLEEALPYQTPNTIAALLTKIDDKSFKFILSHQHKSSRLIQSLLGYLFFEPSWQIELLISRLCSILTCEIVLFSREVYMQGKEIPFALGVALQPYLTNALINLKKTKSFEQYKEIESIISLMPLNDNKHDKDNKILDLSIQNVKQRTDFKDTKDTKVHKDIKHINESNKIITIITSHDRLLPVTIDDEKNLKLFYKEGLKSPYDYHLLKKHNLNGIITQIADSLHRANRLYTGTSVELDLSRYRAYSNHYLELATQGHAIFKIIKGDYKDEKNNLKNDWNDFKKQLSDYHYRPALRKPKSADASHKFHHRTGLVIDYKKSKQAYKKETYFATKKQSATLLSKNLNTIVYGEHVPRRMLVGILAGLTCHIHLRSSLPPASELIPNEYIFTEDEKQTRLLYYIDDNKIPHQMSLKIIDKKHDGLPSKLFLHWTEDEKNHVRKLIHDLHDRRVNKALFTRDRGTYQRAWIGNEKEVKDYQQKIEKINYTDFEKFREKVNQQPHKLNEVLTKFTKHSILAIMIVSDDIASRKVAITRRDEVKKELNIDLPIIFYNRNLRTIRVYSLAEQHDDLMQTNSILQAEQLPKLQLIKKRIYEKPTWNHGFFKGHKTSLPEEMKQILSLIAEVEKDPYKTNQIYKKVEELLIKNSQKSIFRTEDIEQASKGLLIHLKL